jgi:hypothetical protein
MSHRWLFRTRVEDRIAPRLRVLSPSGGVLSRWLPNAFVHRLLPDSSTDQRFKSTHQFLGQWLAWVMRITQNGPEPFNFLIGV